MKKAQRMLAFVFALAVLCLPVGCKTSVSPPEKSQADPPISTAKTVFSQTTVSATSAPETTQPEQTRPPESVPKNSALPKDLPPLGLSGEGYRFEQFFAAAPDAFYVLEEEYQDVQDGEGTSHIKIRTNIIRHSNPASDPSVSYRGRSIYFSGITSTCIFITEYGNDGGYGNVYLLSRETGAKYLVAEDVCGIALYNPANRTLFYAQNPYPPRSDRYRITIWAKNLSTGKVTKIFTDRDYDSRSALLYFDEGLVRFGLYETFEEGQVFSLSDQLKLTKVISPQNAKRGTIIKKISDDLVVKKTDNSACIFVINGTKQTLLTDANRYAVCNEFLYYIQDTRDEASDRNSKNLYRIRLDGSEKKLLRTGTHLTDLFSADGKLFGFASYSVPGLEPDSEYLPKDLTLHWLSFDGKPYSSIVICEKLYQDSFGYRAYPTKGVIFISERGFESVKEYYRGYYDTRMGKFYPSEN